MTQPQIRVMIVEDSDVVRALLEHIVDADPRLAIAASVGSGEEALEALGDVRPDIISLDIRLPGMNGFDVTRRIMRQQPTPIVVVSASLEDEDLDITMNSLQAGALTVIEKPQVDSVVEYEKFAAELCGLFIAMSEVRVIRQMMPPEPRKARPMRASSLMPAPRYAGRTLGLVASTGGPSALALVLQGLGKAFPCPVFAVQHMTPSFLDGFIRWLDLQSPLPVAKGVHGLTVKPGHVYVAPADHHMTLGKGGHIELLTCPPENHQRPSGDAMLRSLARVCGSSAMGAVLTGMGKDGAAGLLSIRDAGGFTVAEHAETSVVYGMPAAACALGAACESVRLAEIGPLFREQALAAVEMPA